MDTSIFVAKIFGLCYLIIGIGFLFNRQVFRQIMEDYCKNAALVFYGGLISLAVGLAIVLNHNVWTMHWPVIITILGWLAILKGIWIIVFPGSLQQFMGAYLENKKLQMFQMIFALLFGAALTFFGFFAR